MAVDDKIENDIRSTIVPSHLLYEYSKFEIRTLPSSAVRREALSRLPPISVGYVAKGTHPRGLTGLIVSAALKAGRESPKPVRPAKNAAGPREPGWHGSGVRPGLVSGG